MAFSEIDNFFVRAIRSLHSNSSESANNIRVLLDDAIKSKYGPGKELGPYANFSNVFHDYPSTSAVNTSNNIKDDLKGGDSSDNELELDLLKEDLLCAVCKGMGVGARNRLVECTECHNLYHQECHDPTISDEEIENTLWICVNCLDTQTNRSGKKSVQSPINISHKSNQVISSKSYDKEYCDIGSTKLMGSKSSSSSSSSTSSKSSGSSSRVAVVTPNINLVSADKRLQIMKKKAAKMQEKRKLSR